MQDLPDRAKNLGRKSAGGVTYLSNWPVKQILNPWMGLEDFHSVCQSCWANLNQSPCEPFSPQTGNMGQGRRGQYSQSKCFLNPFQNPVVQSFQLMPWGCFLKKESAFFSTLGVWFQTLPFHQVILSGLMILLYFYWLFPQSLISQVPSALNKGLNWIQGEEMHPVSGAFLNLL